MNACLAFHYHLMTAREFHFAIYHNYGVWGGWLHPFKYFVGLCGGA